ncbi:MAG: hypothetical protein ACXW1A_05310 [Nitrososphaeraceae archaeon]
MNKLKETSNDHPILREQLDKIYGTNEEWIPNVPNRITRNLARCRKNFSETFSIDQEQKLLMDTMIYLDILLKNLNISWANYNLFERFEDY